MKRLLQRIDNGLYYQGPGVWTTDPDQALAFHKTAVAIECCLQENLPPMQLVLKFEDSAFDIRVPCWTAGKVAASPLGQVQEQPAEYSGGPEVEQPAEAFKRRSSRKTE